jgi:hypothetical protein
MLRSCLVLHLAKVKLRAAHANLAGIDVDRVGVSSVQRSHRPLLHVVRLVSRLPARRPPCRRQALLADAASRG